MALGDPLPLATMIELPIGFTTNLASSASEQISNFSPLITLIMGLLLALVAVGALIGFINRK